MKSPLSAILIAYLNLADLEGGFIFVSFKLGKIGFFSINLNNFLCCKLLGKYREAFLFSE